MDPGPPGSGSGSESPSAREREWAEDNETEAAPVPAPGPGAPGRATQHPEAFLIVRNGERLAQVPLHEGGEWIVGRGAAAQIVADDRQVSRRHARLSLRAGVLAVEDLASRNGIVVNGSAVRGATVRIETGDIVEVGGCQLVVASRAGRVSATRTATPESSARLVDVVIADPEMARLYASMQKVAAMPTTVLILGETGTGKDVLAQRMHQWSPRAGEAFVRVNCASIPESLLESELFGHERGAFTGAERRKAGYFEAAQRGTIFLDEIGELSAAAQVRLLNVLENRTVTRLGATSPVALDVRVVCATHRDLQALVRADRFRADLFYRISPFTVRVPPLRERQAEITLLADVFARQLAAQMGTVPPTLGSDFLQPLLRYGWPGNVRELRNVVERAFVMAEGGPLLGAHLVPEIRLAMTPSPGTQQAVRGRSIDTERATIEDALAAEGGNQTRAAARLGMPRRTLVYKLAQYRRAGEKGAAGGKDNGD